MKMIRDLLVVAAALFASPALAQTSPNWSFGFVPTPAQWNAAFGNKQDYLGSPPLQTSGGIMTGALITAPSITTAAGLNVPVGVAPTSPNNGDIWETAAGIFARINGATLGPLLGGTQGANTILGNASGTATPSPLAIPSCSGVANAVQWVLNTGFQCGTIVAAASSVQVGVTSISGGTVGNVLYHATSNLLGELTTSGSGTVLVLATGATLAGATIGTSTISAPVLSGTITGTYTLGGTPSIAGAAITSGTISGSWLSAINLAASGNGGVTGVLPIAGGGTSQSTQAAAFNALAPTATRAGDVTYWNGSAYVNLAGNNSGTQVLQETSSGVPSWATITGLGTVTSITLAAGSGISLSGTNPITNAGTITVSGAVPAPQGRITLAANTPVMGPTSCSGSPCANQSTLRYDCSNGSSVPYFNGTTDLLDAIASCEVTDAMVAAVSAGQVVAANVYDVWWFHSGANRICLAMSAAGGGGGGWAADTGGSNQGRGTGYTAIDQITRGYPTNANSIANCFNGSTNYGSIAANRATYLGTVYANNNGQVSYVLGTGVSGGGQAVLGVWNVNNQVDVATTVNDTKTSWAFSTGTTRFVDASALNSIIFVSGLPVHGIKAWAQETGLSSAAGSGVNCGFALDGGTNGPFDATGIYEQSGGTNVVNTCFASNNYDPVSGVHTLTAYENALNSLTFTAQGTVNNRQGLGFSTRM